LGRFRLDALGEALTRGKHLVERRAVLLLETIEPVEPLAHALELPSVELGGVTFASERRRHVVRLVVQGAQTLGELLQRGCVPRNGPHRCSGDAERFAGVSVR